MKKNDYLSEMIFLTEKMHDYMKTNIARIRDFRAIRLLVSVTMLMIVGGVVRARAAGREFNDGVFIYQVINEEDKTCQVIGVVQGSMDHVGEYLTLPGKVMDGSDTYSVKRIAYCHINTSGIFPKNIKKLTISEGIEEIVAGSFGDIDVLGVAFPNSLRTIGKNAFYDWGSMEEIYLGENIEYIDDGAFGISFSYRPRQVYVNSQVPPTIHRYAFRYDYYRAYEDFMIEEDCTLYIPKGSYERYINTEPWNKFGKIEEIDFSSIDGVSVDEATEVLKVEVRNGEVSFPGLAADERIEVYSMGGRMVYGGTNRPVSLPKGLYLACAKGVAAKVAVR